MHQICASTTEMPPCFCILENKRMSARVENSTFFACCFGHNSLQQLSHTPNCTAALQLGGQSVMQTDQQWWGGPGLGSNHFARVLLGQLKEKTDRPGNPVELPLASESTITTLGGLSRCTSERQRSGLPRRASSSTSLEENVKYVRRRRPWRKLSTTHAHYLLSCSCNYWRLLVSVEV